METRERLVARLKAAGKNCREGLFTDVEGFCFLVPCDKRTERQWREDETGPKWYRGVNIFYELEDIAAWFNNRSGGKILPAPSGKDRNKPAKT